MGGDTVHLTMEELQAIKRAQDILGSHTHSLWANKARQGLQQVLRNVRLQLDDKDGA